MYTEDTDGSRRAEIGDSALEISFKNTYSSNKPKSYPVDSKGPEFESSELARKLMSNSSDVLRFLNPVDSQTAPVPYNPMTPYVPLPVPGVVP
jgi:hypothetical protein